PSGAGKSSLINRLRVQPTVQEDGKETPPAPFGSFDVSVNILGDGGGGAGKGSASILVENMQSVASVAPRTGRGRHTTRHVSLLQMPGGGLLADTPGFGNPGLESVTTLALQACFPEIRLALQDPEHSCAFGNCTHRREPGCAVGTDWERYEHYQLLWDEVEAIETTFRRNFAKDEREGNVRYKSGAQGQRRPEARLNQKKHRRTSRTQSRRDLKNVIEMEEDDDEY
ncbi:hypothetical protein CYMTET_37122, partial [Cymbomonas tetramitiformis]